MASGAKILNVGTENTNSVVRKPAKHFNDVSETTNGVVDRRTFYKFRFLMLQRPPRSTLPHHTPVSQSTNWKPET